MFLSQRTEREMVFKTRNVRGPPVQGGLCFGLLEEFYLKFSFMAAIPLLSLPSEEASRHIELCRWVVGC